MKKSLFGLALFGLSLLATTARVSAVSLVSLTPTSTTLAETQSTSVQVRLDQPLFAPSTPYLHINMTSSDPSRVTISPNPVNYGALDWFNTKTFTVTAVDDGVHNASDTVTISFLVDSNSEIYDQFSGSFVLSITDINPAPTVLETQTTATAPATTTTATTTPKATLADTGQQTMLVQVVSLGALVGSVFLLRKVARASK